MPDMLAKLIELKGNQFPAVLTEIEWVLDVNDDDDGDEVIIHPDYRDCFTFILEYKSQIAQMFLEGS